MANRLLAVNESRYFVKRTLEPYCAGGRCSLSHSRLAWRFLAFCAWTWLVLALVQEPLSAQQLRLWDTWDDRPVNVLAIGLGAHAGLAGVSYTHFLPGTPFAVGLGAGVFGVAARVEITMPRLHVHRAWMDEPQVRETYLSLGIAAVPYPRLSDLMRPAVLLEGGRRIWRPRPDRPGTSYLDIGFGVIGRPWSGPGDTFFAPMVRAQIGWAL